MCSRRMKRPSGHGMPRSNMEVRRPPFSAARWKRKVDHLGRGLPASRLTSLVQFRCPRCQSRPRCCVGAHGSSSPKRQCGPTGASCFARRPGMSWPKPGEARRHPRHSSCRSFPRTRSRRGFAGRIVFPTVMPSNGVLLTAATPTLARRRSGPVAVFRSVRGDALTGLQRVLIVVDAANGISAVLPFATWTFVPIDLIVTACRIPEAEWVGMAARTTIGTDGIGITETILFDGGGAFGRALQTLYVAPR